MVVNPNKKTRIFLGGRWEIVSRAPIKIGTPPAGAYVKPKHPLPGELCPNCGASVVWKPIDGDDMCSYCGQIWRNMTPRRGVPVGVMA